MVVLFDQFNMPEDIFELVFATEQQAVVAKLLIKYMKENGGEISKTEMSVFATKLHDGTLIEPTENKVMFQQKRPPLSYNKRQFYDRILTPMKAMGLIQYDLYKKTYGLSDKFNKNLTHIGLLWLRELRK